MGDGMGKKAAAKRLAKAKNKSGISDTPERQKMEAYFGSRKPMVDSMSDDDIAALFVAERHGLHLGGSADLLLDRKCSPLHSAVMFGNLEAARVLIEFGVALERKDNLGQTPLHLSVICPNIEITKCLLESGAKIDAQDSRLWTALHFAANSQRAEFVALLIEHGANETLKSSDGKTASELSPVIAKVKAGMQAREHAETLAEKHNITLGNPRNRRRGDDGAL